MSSGPTQHTWVRRNVRQFQEIVIKFQDLQKRSEFLNEIQEYSRICLKKSDPHKKLQTTPGFSGKFWKYPEFSRIFSESQPPKFDVIQAKFDVIQAEFDVI